MLIRTMAWCWRSSDYFNDPPFSSEGEGLDPDLWSRIGQFILYCISYVPPDTLPIRVTFTSTESGTLRIEALDKINNLPVPVRLKLNHVRDEKAIQKRKLELDKLIVSG